MTQTFSVTLGCFRDTILYNHYNYSSVMVPPVIQVYINGTYVPKLVMKKAVVGDTATYQHTMDLNSIVYFTTNYANCGPAQIDLCSDPACTLPFAIR